MRILLIIFCIISIAHAEVYSVGPFYPVFDEFLVLKVNQSKDSDFSDLLFGKEESPRWINISEEVLNEVGLKVGEKIQTFNFESGKVKTYVVKKKMQALLIENPWRTEKEGLPFFSTFYIFLGDKQPSNDPDQNNGADKANGIAYSGKEFEFKDDRIFKPKNERPYLNSKMNEKFNFIKNADEVQIINPPSMHSCLKVIVTKDKSSKKYIVACDSGGC